MKPNHVDGARDYGPEIAGSGRLLTLIVAANFMLGMNRPLMAALLEPIRHELSLTDTQLGLLTGIAYSGATLVFMIPAGMMGDRFSRKAMITAMVTLLSIFTALCGAAGSFALLLLARMGVGASGPVIPVLGLSMIADAFPKERQSGATGVFYAVSGMGALVSFAVGAWVAQHYGWRVAFFMGAAPGLIVVPLLIALVVEPPRGGTAERAPNIGFRRGLGTVVKNGPLVWLLVANALANLGSVALISWSTSLFIRNHGLPLSQAGLIVAIATGIFFPLGQFVGGRVGDKLSRKPGAPMWFSGAAVAAGAVLGVIAALAPSTPVAVAALFAAATAVLLNMGPIFALVMQLAPVDVRTTVFAILSVLGNVIAWGGAPYIIGSLSDLIGGAHSLSYAVAIVMAFTLFPALMFVLLGNRLASNTPVR